MTTVAAGEPRAAVPDPADGPFCDACGAPQRTGEHTRCAQRRRASDPPRFCTSCGRRLAVQVLPVGYTAACVSCGPINE